jgi:hypothetical protein
VLFAAGRELIAAAGALWLARTVLEGAVGGPLHPAPGAETSDDRR